MPAGALDLPDLSHRLLLPLVTEVGDRRSRGMRSCSQPSPVGTHKEPAAQNPEHSPSDPESQCFCESEIKLSDNHDPNLTLIFKTSDQSPGLHQGLHSTGKVLSSASGGKESTLQLTFQLLRAVVYGSSWQTATHKTDLAAGRDRDHVAQEADNVYSPVLCRKKSPASGSGG